MKNQGKQGAETNPAATGPRTKISRQRGGNLVALRPPEASVQGVQKHRAVAAQSEGEGGVEKRGGGGGGQGRPPNNYSCLLPPPIPNLLTAPYAYALLNRVTAPYKVL